jgi:hypothetical protein
MSHMSNQWKAEFLATFFVCEDSGAIMVKFHQKTVLYRQV